ncbi:MAG: phosphoribosylaminoimidazolesuccinocarboxamide synthase, partial [Flavobacteriales bacterium]|nr:phosphoribosylaminoimidazolesuccinocarboxamide synthase [Flavobacteriales bacterium]
QILREGAVTKIQLDFMYEKAIELFSYGSQVAESKGLILVDTKYEFGKDSEGNITLIDEIHTPDSSRYFYINGYEDKVKNGETPKQLSKEFVRQWLIENGFQGKEGQEIPFMSEEYVTSVSERYIELYEIIIGEKFIKEDISNVVDRIEKNINNFLEN